MALYANDFAKAFSDLIDKSGVSCYRIGQFANLDEAYLSRLKSGARANPSPEVLVKICLALARFSDKLEITDFESLFNAAGRSLHPKHRN